MDPADRNINPFHDVPLFQSIEELNKSFTDGDSSRITKSLDKCIEEYEKVVTFLNSPVERSNGLCLTYALNAVLGGWKRLLPSVIAQVAALQLDHYSTTLKGMQTDNRYRVICF